MGAVGWSLFPVTGELNSLVHAPCSRVPSAQVDRTGDKPIGLKMAKNKKGIGILVTAVDGKGICAGIVKKHDWITHIDGARATCWSARCRFCVHCGQQLASCRGTLAHARAWCACAASVQLAGCVLTRTSDAVRVLCRCWLAKAHGMRTQCPCVRFPWFSWFSQVLYTVCLCCSG